MKSVASYTVSKVIQVWESTWFCYAPGLWISIWSPEGTEKVQAISLPDAFLLYILCYSKLPFINHFLVHSLIGVPDDDNQFPRHTVIIQNVPAQLSIHSLLIVEVDIKGKVPSQWLFHNVTDCCNFVCAQCVPVKAGQLVLKQKQILTGVDSRIFLCSFIRNQGDFTLAA